MLQVPSHLSRVCGHGHIKKFWLMQTQKESQTCESKSSVLFSSSSTPRSGNRTSLKGLDSPWSPSSPLPHTPGYGDAPSSAKHVSLTCAETLSSPSNFGKAAHPLSPHSTLSVEGIAQMKNTSEPQMRNASEHQISDTICRTVSEEAIQSTAPPRISSVNVVSEHGSEPHLEPATSPTEEESLSSDGAHRSDDPPSFSADDSTNSIASLGHSNPIQNGKGLYAGADICNMHSSVKGGVCSSAVHKFIGVREKAGDGKAAPSIVRLPVPGVAVVSAPESGRFHGAAIVSRSHDNYMDRHYQGSQVPGLKACTLCGTTKTPMWRSGPQGPKSLCNACGIRFKKYRAFPGQNGSPEHELSSFGQITPKALARPLKRKHNSAVPSGDSSRPQKISFKSGVPDVASEHQRKVKWHELAVRREQLELNRESSHRWKTAAPPACFKKIYGCAPFQSKFKKLAPLDEHRSVSRVFAKDEEEAAVLLMHLSCGLVY